MEKETCTFSFCAKPAIEEIETDLLLIGGGMACCGAAFEAARWANPKKIKVTMVDKAGILETSRLWREATARMLCPSRILPSSSERAISDSNSRWIARFNGRAPKSGSYPARIR